jgi:hypothetical protein
VESILSGRACKPVNLSSLMEVVMMFGMARTGVQDSRYQLQLPSPLLSLLWLGGRSGRFILVFSEGWL